MSGVKHTPWEHPGTKLYAVFNGHYWDVCVGPNEFSHTVGSCHRNRPLGYDLYGAERYARLIAAAPDLFEAASAVLAQHDNPVRDGKTHERFEALRAALSKATAQQEGR